MQRDSEPLARGLGIGIRPEQGDQLVARDRAAGFDGEDGRESEGMTSGREAGGIAVLHLDTRASEQAEMIPGNAHEPRN